LDRPGRDSIRLIDDSDGDGKFDRVTVFAEGLNIPIGIVPYRDGCIAFSIPNIVYFEDTDGDRRSDRQHKLYGPFDYTRDTHGLNNGFRRGFDGWIYACHGWANESSVAGADGHTVAMNGGNTYRFQPDGSRIEHYTHGQVNPFGMTFDEYGDLFNADCHTRPITMLLRNGYYDSFGKPHNGLGYVPPVMEHLHGSTAIAGTTWYSGSQFPEEFQGNMFCGNVVTSRVNRDIIRRRGGTVVATEELDFVVCDDLWFRPVDLQVGPDGAIYIADFYNKVIGHVEVPLDHPARDRYRGRIWRVSYGGESTKVSNNRQFDLSTLSAMGLIAAFADPNLGVRMRAADEIVDRVGPSAIPLLKDHVKTSPNAYVRLHSLWALHRLGATSAVQQAIADSDPSSLVRVHMMRILAETAQLDDAAWQLIVNRLRDASGLVQRAAVDAMGKHPRIGGLSPLLELAERASQSDVHLQHAIKIALLEHLKQEEISTACMQEQRSDSQELRLGEVLLAVPSKTAGSILHRMLVSGRVPVPVQKQYLNHIARYLPDEMSYERLANLAKELSGADLEHQLDLLMAVRLGLQQRGEDPERLADWAEKLANKLLGSIDLASLQWRSITPSGDDGPAWKLEPRAANGRQPGPFLSTLELGEGYKGRLRSTAFTIPPRLSLELCGHLGHPDSPPVANSAVRLRVVGSDEIIAESTAPRSDVAHRVHWELSQYSGKQGYLEIEDAVDAAAYAWIAVGNIDPPVVSVLTADPVVVTRRLESAALLAKEFRLASLQLVLTEVAASGVVPLAARVAAVDALEALDPRPIWVSLIPVLRQDLLSGGLKEKVIEQILDRTTTSPEAAVISIFRMASDEAQRTLALAISEVPAGVTVLLNAVEAGAASPRLLLDTAIRERIVISASSDTLARLERLTADLPDIREEMQARLQDAQKAFLNAKRSVRRGREVFNKHCAACHSFAGQGGLVGPQLDGISSRGHHRILEDIVDPNRNVDPKFFTTLVQLDDGHVLSGLVHREEGELLYLVDSTGKQYYISKSNIEERMLVKRSLMPDNFFEVLKTDELFDLVEYLQTDRQTPGSPIAWRENLVDRSFRSEGVTVADVNRDGKLDVLVGELWYEAPDWVPHEIATVGDYGDGSGSYSSAFLCFADDVNGDGWPDQIVIGTPGEAAYWYENPRAAKRHWRRHLLWPSACNETPLYVDLFGTGKRVLVMAWQPEGSEDRGQMAWFEPGPDPQLPWLMHPISSPSSESQIVPGTQRFSHGLGVGDLNGDGRLDVLCTAGWWEQPSNVSDQPWTFHPASLGEPCANMHVADLDGDGVPDVLSSSAHNYGIWRHRGKKVAAGRLTFSTEAIFPDLLSQTHALLYDDLDGNGHRDLVTGKRWWAHGPAGDPGSHEPAHLYWFEAQPDAEGIVQFTPRLIHADSGVGLQFCIEDMNGDQLLDVIVSNKKGVRVFEQVRRTPLP